MTVARARLVRLRHRDCNRIVPYRLSQRFIATVAAIIALAAFGHSGRPNAVAMGSRAGAMLAIAGIFLIGALQF